MRIVSAYFPIPSKQPQEFYHRHVERFLNGVVETMTFFTTPDFFSIVKTWPRFDQYTAEWVLMDVDELVAFQKFGREFFQRQRERWRR